MSIEASATASRAVNSTLRPPIPEPERAHRMKAFVTLREMPDVVLVWRYPRVPFCDASQEVSYVMEAWLTRLGMLLSWVREYRASADTATSAVPLAYMLYPPVGTMKDMKAAYVFMRLVLRDLRKKMPLIEEVKLDCLDK